jgi:hypothetical protein
MPREYFGCWNRTFDDLSNTETASEQTYSSKDDRASKRTQRYIQVGRAVKRRVVDIFLAKKTQQR